MAKIRIVFIISILLILTICNITNSSIIYVPADSATIQSGIDGANHGDTVLVADGIYVGEGCHNIRFFGKKITLKSENGPESTIIRSENYLLGHYCFEIVDGEDSTTVIDGFSITDWKTWDRIGGGTVICDNASPTIKNCVFYDNHVNKAHGTGAGGGILFFYSQAIVINCTFTENYAEYGSAVHSIFSSVSLYNCLMAFNTGRSAVGGSPFVDLDSIYFPKLYNCNMYNNNTIVEEWVYPLISENELNLDPLFCDSDVNDFSLYSVSPCLPENNEYGAFIGALGEGCQYNYICGDTDQDGIIDIKDIVYLVNYYFYVGPQLPHTYNGDLNCDGSINLTDLVLLNQLVFHSGLANCCP